MHIVKNNKTFVIRETRVEFNDKLKTIINNADINLINSDLSMAQMQINQEILRDYFNKHFSFKLKKPELLLCFQFLSIRDHKEFESWEDVNESFYKLISDVESHYNIEYNTFDYFKCCCSKDIQHILVWYMPKNRQITCGNVCINDGLVVDVALQLKIKQLIKRFNKEKKNLQEIVSRIKNNSQYDRDYVKGLLHGKKCLMKIINNQKEYNKLNGIIMVIENEKKKRKTAVKEK